MKVGASVSYALWALDQGDSEHAALHACNAVDGTAKKRFPTKGVRDRFTRLMRDCYWMVEPMCAPGINLDTSRWNVRAGNPPRPRVVDFADLVYLVHRCTHGHGDELPGGFELLPDVQGPDGVTHMVAKFDDETVQLSDRLIPALVSLSVLTPENDNQEATEGAWLSYEGERLIVNDWWGAIEQFPTIIASYERMPRVTMNLTDEPLSE